MAINNTKIDIQIGKFLAAEPFMLDPNFKRVVILICDHQETEGTIGFVLNKSVNMNITDLVSNFPEFDCEVFFGGPVQTDTIHYIHRLGDEIPNSMKVMDGVWFGGDYEELKTLASLGLIEPKDIRFFVENELISYSHSTVESLIKKIKTIESVMTVNAKPVPQTKKTFVLDHQEFSSAKYEL